MDKKKIFKSEALKEPVSESAAKTALSAEISHLTPAWAPWMAGRDDNFLMENI